MKYISESFKRGITFGVCLVLLIEMVLYFWIIPIAKFLLK